MIPFEGVITIWGEPGIGKTTAALTCSTDPSKVLMLDFDSGKGRDICEELNIEYIDCLQMLVGNTEVTFYEKFYNFVKGIKSKYDVIILDNPVIIFMSVHSHVIKHPNLYREEWNPMGKYKGPQQHNTASKQALPSLFTILRDKAKVVIFVAHDKDQVDDLGAKTGATVADGHKALFKASGLVVRLTPDVRKGGPAPVGLIIKKPRAKINPNIREVVEYFPWRIAPFSWDAFSEYLKNPFGLRDPLEDEIPDEEEFLLIRGELNPQQQKVYELNRQLLALQLEEQMREDISEALANTSAPNDLIKVNKVTSAMRDIYPSVTAELVGEVLKTMRELANG